MAITSISICNKALTYLSAERILALTENSENARRCNAIYDYTRDEIIASHTWKFATKWASLAQLDETPINGYTYAFALPADFIKERELYTDYSFYIESSKLYTNDSSPKLNYIARVTDESKFPPYFAEALSRRIAADLAFGITQNASLAELAFKLADNALREAKQIDSQGATPREPRRSRILDERKM